MVSWMVHFRIADRLLDMFETMPQREFIVGNIAPDSGEPNEDWSAYFPSKEVSHWRLEGVQKEEWSERFREKYLYSEDCAEKKAFYLGYYIHLLTDHIWGREMHFPLKERLCCGVCARPTIYMENQSGYV